MALREEPAFDPSDPAFLENPYPVLNGLRERARVFYDESRGRWFVTRHEDVRACLRDRRLGRNFRHVMTPEEIGVPELDPRWHPPLGISDCPGRSRSTGGPPPTWKPSAGEWPAFPGR